MTKNAPADQYLCDVFGPADTWDVLPDGTTVGTTLQFIGFSIGFGGQHLLRPDEADKLADLIREASAKCRALAHAAIQEHLKRLEEP